jgi:hypothetical protein
MNFSDISTHNPRLFFDGICRRKIPYSAMVAELQTGTAVTSSFIEGIVGGPIQPGNASFSGDPPIGSGGSYPRPWRSFSQNLQNGTYGSLIGPYARLVRLPNVDNVLFPNTCLKGQKPRSCGGTGRGTGIFGRIGLGDGQDLGFRSQDWYHQDEGIFGTDYYNTEFGLNWLTWKNWWDSSSKKTIRVKWIGEVFGDPLVDVEVAYATPDVEDAAYYPGFNLSAFANSSQDLLTVMLGVAILARWI